MPIINKCELIREQLIRDSSFSHLNYNYDIIKFVFTTNMDVFNCAANPNLSMQSEVNALKEAIRNDKDKKL